jgi:hypothetical protein
MVQHYFKKVSCWAGAAKGVARRPQQNDIGRQPVTDYAVISEGFTTGEMGFTAAKLHSSKFEALMSALGQKRTFREFSRRVPRTSANGAVRFIV